MDHDRYNKLGKIVFLFLGITLAILATDVGADAQVTAADPAEIAPAIASRLTSQLRSGSTEEKRQALFEIRNRESAAASRLAIPALLDQDIMVRATAAASVVFLPRAEAFSALVPLLSDKSEFVRREAAYALGDVRDPAAVQPLIRLMQNDKIPEVRTAAAVSLGKIGDVSGLDSLVAILKKRPVEDDEFLRRSAARSVGQIAQVSSTGDPAVLTPQNFLPEKFKELGSAKTNKSALKSPAFSAAVDVLLRVLQNKDEADDTRREAAFSLGAIGDSKAVPALQSYLSGPDPYLVEICKEALEKIRRLENSPS